jgi:3-oxoacyl-[acyl-carrier-protein] synthase-3
MASGNAVIRAVEYHLPSRRVTNEDLIREFPDWTVEKISRKTGIDSRHIAADGECASDLALCAAEKLLARIDVPRDEIDFLILCTQSPDYFLPTTACVLQHRLGLPDRVGAYDFNLGCSGYIYGLGMAKGLIETGQAANVLLLTAETYSKHIHPADRSLRTIFGDAAAATLISAAPADQLPESIGPFLYGTDGKGARNLIVAAGAMRHPSGRPAPGDAQAAVSSNLHMDGGEVLAFTLRVVPSTVNRLLERSGKTLDDIDLFVFHQANQYMLDHLRSQLKIPAGKFYVALRECANTVSSTIPIALHEAARSGALQPGHTVMLVGFGVGYSWGAALVRWA